MNSIPMNYLENFAHKKLTHFPAFGRAKAPATCGELMQGTIGKMDFLVNSPISYHADVQVRLNLDGAIRVQTPGIFDKVREVVEKTLRLLGYVQIGADIEVKNAIPGGKGMASSTAEMSAALSATLAALGLPEHWMPQFADLLLEIDHSTDAVYLPGITWCQHLSGTTIKLLGNPPALAFVIVDTGGEVETVSFDRAHARRVSHLHSRRLAKALHMMIKGFRTQNASLIASAATESARINQEVLHKDELQTLIEGTAAYGGLGVNCAHTGTVLGVMFDPIHTCPHSLRARVETLVGSGKIIGVHQLISGGVCSAMA